MSFLSKIKAAINSPQSPLQQLSQAPNPFSPIARTLSGRDNNSGGAAKKGDGGVMTMSLDDLGSGSPLSPMNNKAAEEPLWLDVKDAKEIDWNLLDWKLDDLAVRQTAFECLILGTELCALLKDTDDVTLRLFMKGLGITQRGKKRIIDDCKPIGSKIPATSAQSSVDVHSLRANLGKTQIDDDDDDGIDEHVEEVDDEEEDGNNHDTNSAANSNSDQKLNRKSTTRVLKPKPKSVYAHVQYQMLMLLMKRVEHFDDPKVFQEWHERHAQILLHSVAGHVTKATTAVRNWEYGGKMLTSKQIQSKLTQSIEAMCDDFVRKQWWRSCEDGYVKCLENLQDLIQRVASTVGSTCTSLHDAEHFLPYAFPVNVVLYERLLNCAFDPDSGDLDVKNVNAMMDMLRYVRDSFCMTQGLHAVCYGKLLYLQYVKNLKPERMEMFREILPQVIAAGASECESFDYATLCEREYAGILLDMVSEHFYTRLCDYHKLFDGNPSALSNELSMWINIREVKAKKLGAKPNADQIKGEIEGIISAAMTKWYHSVVDDYILPLRLADAMDLTDTLSKQVDIEKEVFSPVFSEHHHAAMGAALRTMIKEFQPHVTDALNEIPVLNQESAELLHKLKIFEERVHEYEVDNSKHEFDLVSLCRRLVSKWVADQRTHFKPFMESCVRQASWVPLKPPEELHARSCADLFQIFHDSLNAFSDMAIPHSASFIKPLVKGFADTVEEYCKFAVMDTTNIPLPKQPPCISNKKEKESLVELLTPEEEAHYDKMKIPSLCVRLNSVDYCRLGLENLRSKLTDSGPIQVLDTCIHTCKSSGSEIRKFIAARTVYYDLQGPLLKGLYVPTVEDSRMKNVLDSFESTLGTLYQMIAQSERQAVITDVYVTFLAGFEFVLMHGGIKRIFKHEHCKLFQQDLQILQEFFLEGLPPKVVTSCSRHIDDLLRELFSKSSKELIDEYQKAKDCDPRILLTKYNIFRVLRHRTKVDGVAKKFIRKFKMNAELREFIKNLKQG